MSLDGPSPERLHIFSSAYDLSGRRTESAAGLTVDVKAPPNWAPSADVVDRLVTEFLATHRIETDFTATVSLQAGEPAITYSGVALLGRWREATKGVPGGESALPLAVPLIFSLEFVDTAARDNFLRTVADLFPRNAIREVSFKVAAPPPPSGAE